MKNKILGTIGLIGFFVLIGAVGALEQDTISIARCLIQSVIGLLAMTASAHFSGAMDYNYR